MLFGPVEKNICKYQDIEDTYTNNLDTWLANLYFGITKRDTLGNPYTVHLVLDKDTEKRHAKYMQLYDEDEVDVDKTASQRALPEGGQNSTEDCSRFSDGE